VVKNIYACMYVYVYVYIRTDTHTQRYIKQKKVNLTHEKGQYFLSLVSESETHILYRFITQSEIFQAFIY